MSRKIRVRFAPSPTGPLHIGGVRTALYNYLFAKAHGGDFILRIEDTDRSRYVEGAEEYIAESLIWCGLQPDEGPADLLSGANVTNGYGPYRQSERRHLYRAFAEELLARGRAYYAFDTPAELEKYRAEQEAEGNTFMYNASNRGTFNNSLGMGADELQARLEQGTDYVIRFYTPQNQEIAMSDQIRGEISVDTNTLDDKVLFKSDGMPTYHLANIVDDHLMEISHVIRGEEWLPSLPLHTMLYEAFGWEKPIFAHLPLLMKPTGKGKLSKRDGERMGVPVFPLSWGNSSGFREAGYFPEAVVNFLAMLGWNPGTEQELFSLAELVKSFDITRVHKSGARFDPDKTKWYNHQWLQRKEPGELAKLWRPMLDEHGISSAQWESERPGYMEEVVALLQERATFVSDFWTLGHYFFQPPKAYDERGLKKAWKSDTPEILGHLRDMLVKEMDFTSEHLETFIKGWISEEGLSFGKVMPALRLVIVGAMEGPHLFDIMALLGREESLARIDRALQAIG